MKPYPNSDLRPRIRRPARWACICLVVAIGLLLTSGALSAASLSSQALLPGTELAKQAFSPITHSALVEMLIGEVQQSDLYQLIGNLSGENEIEVDGETYTLDTRNSYSETYILTATEYVSAYLAAQGLEVSFMEWYTETEDEEPYTVTDVIAELPGTVHPDEIILITAHLDNMPEGENAPGADDNASGSAAVMLAAARMAGHTFERTVRFVLLTDEEYDQYGSQLYAEHCRNLGENILAVYNMDMVGWDGNNDGHVYLETRKITETGYTSDLAIYGVFTQVVDLYGLSSVIAPHIEANHDEFVDSWNFWDNGFPGVTAIEDYEGLEVNPYYHTEGDTLTTLNMPFYTNFFKASLGAIAHLAIPVDPVVYTYIYLPITLR